MISHSKWSSPPLLWKPFPFFWEFFLQDFHPEEHLWGRTLIRDKSAWIRVLGLQSPFYFLPKVFSGVWGQRSMWTSQILSYLIYQTRPLWTLFCALKHSHTLVLPLLSSCMLVLHLQEVAYSFYTDVNPRGGLKLCSYWVHRGMVAFTLVAMRLKKKTTWIQRLRSAIKQLSCRLHPHI